MRHAHIHPYAGSRWLRLYRNVLIKRQGEPPDTVALGERGGGIEGATLKGFFVVGRESHRDAQRLAFVQRGNSEPVVERLCL